MLSKKFFFTASITLSSIVFLTACSKSNDSSTNLAKPAVVVEITTAHKVKWNDTVIATGIFNAEQAVMLKAEVAGRIIQTPYPSGSAVKMNEPLLQINPEGLQKQLEQDEANLQLMKSQFNQMQTVYNRHAVSKAQYDVALANLKQAQARVAETQQKLQLSEVKAPFDGTLGIRLVDNGDYVNVGQNLVTIQHANKMRVDFALPAEAIGRVSLGDAVIAKSSIVPDVEFAAKISAIDSIANVADNTVLVRSVVENPTAKLIPGSFATVTVLIETSAPAILIPQTSIIYAAEGSAVYKVVKGVAKRTPVKLGERRGDMIVITRGLNDDDQVVSMGKDKVSEGSPVTSTQ